MKVWFRCDRKNHKMFVLNSSKEIDSVPLIGDVIETNNKDFSTSTFRVKPYFRDKEYKILKNTTHLNFKVISRKYSLYGNEWELICEPTAESLLFLLKRLKAR